MTVAALLHRDLITELPVAMIPIPATPAPRALPLFNASAKATT